MIRTLPPSPSASEATERGLYSPARILFFGDMAATGFGTVTMDLGRELLLLGLDVRFMSLNEQPDDDLPEPFKSRTASLGRASGWLGSEDPAMTSERIGAMFAGGLFEDGWTPEQAIVVGDVASLKISPVLSVLPEGFPLWHYVPIEGVGMPPAYGDIFRRVKPVAMSEFGADEIAKLTGERPPVVYHGVDTQQFQPVTPTTPLRMVGKKPVVLRDRGECRDFLGWPRDEFIMFRADRHMPRKQYPVLMRAVAAVLDHQPSARLIWHCRTQDQGGDLADERSKYPERIARRMNSTGLHDTYGGVPRPILRMMYAAADLYVSASAEGFGLTIAEALACGTPAVGLHFSAVPEVIGPGGWTVPVGYLVENVYSHFWAAPDHAGYVAAIEAAHADRAERLLRGKKGMFHVLTHFSWRKAAEQFAGLIAGLPEPAPRDPNDPSDEGPAQIAEPEAKSSLLVMSQRRRA